MHRNKPTGPASRPEHNANFIETYTYNPKQSTVILIDTRLVSHRYVCDASLSGLHVDAFGSHFWMYLVSGRKRWRFYRAEDAGRLGPVWYNSLDPVFRPSASLPPSYTGISANINGKLSLTRQNIELPT